MTTNAAKSHVSLFNRVVSQLTDIALTNTIPPAIAVGVASAISNYNPAITVGTGVGVIVANIGTKIYNNVRSIPFNDASVNRIDAWEKGAIVGAFAGTIVHFYGLTPKIIELIR
ncbi:MAG: hypothetical protein A3J37_03135 [Alphaproteobacteria bacterium RIFCSPHIGHO2_12_FULL_45_9]|nr:MAG: hypothetical protein A3B66_09240 [Alphaproteobacteria bacterium RIFCSPHIGHO2_02_FULL_46_13]OFW95692.1 MAG: hypothetical protein A3J37_03135 [Alphaproteobacteria bacterium RIFCSPHIGHO2_12_FULL_45_9]